MVEELNKVTTLEGISGKKYVFSLWTFEDFDDVKSTFTGGGAVPFYETAYCRWAIYT